ncbi:MAG TPA: biosynthetic peptidoglycan transglycosylase [Candidatus Acidoferrum sp.]|jgi:penicillin-binding protein 1A|nr:biosynthetic peptidoglycan transglycosylase [Candidatus Acidoferrum sp.]
MSSWAPAPLRRVALTLVALVAVVLPSLVTAWVLTPSAADVQQRVRERTDALGVVLLRQDEVPKVLAQAVVATEDESFYSHHGIDSIGLGRALLYDATNFCACQGGSTITEQLAKDVYLGGSDLGYNKLEDLVLALKVEQVIGKQQILADYVSVIPTGLNRYGVSAAACAYFHAPLSSLTLGEYALLAGVTQAPSLYDPTVDSAAALSRRSHVLSAMVADKMISQDQAAAANAEPALVTTGPGC